MRDAWERGPESHEGERGQPGHAVIRLAPEDERSYREVHQGKQDIDHHPVDSVGSDRDAQRMERLEVGRGKAIYKTVMVGEVELGKVDRGTDDVD